MGNHTYYVVDDELANREQPDRQQGCDDSEDNAQKYDANRPATQSPVCGLDCSTKNSKSARPRSSRLFKVRNMPAVWNYDEPAVRYLAYRGASKFNEITHLRACLGRGVAPKPWQPLPLKYDAATVDI